jgi:hypothetical protein
MATATAPRNDIYLSVLAGRAVTALADLAGNRLAWNERVETGLNDGIVFCQTVRARGDRALVGKSSEGFNLLKRSVENAQEANSNSTNPCELSERVEQFLSQVASRKHEPEISELAEAIEFLRKTASYR